jgi:hypothetical protein
MTFVRDKTCCISEPDFGYKEFFTCSSLLGILDEAEAMIKPKTSQGIPVIMIASTFLCAANKLPYLAKAQILSLQVDAHLFQ